jgi:hypothetical protein
MKHIDFLSKKYPFVLISIPRGRNEHPPNSWLRARVMNKVNFNAVPLAENDFS